MTQGGRQIGVDSGFLGRFTTFLNQNKLGELLVRSGRISQDALQLALTEQRQTATPLGQVLVNNKLISRRALRWTLGKQIILRGVVALLFFTLSFGSFGTKRARADIKDVPAQVSIALNTDQISFAKSFAAAALFDTDEKRSTNLGAFTKWAGMFSRFEREINNPSARGKVAAWQAQLADLRGLSLKTMASRVNDMMNEKPYIIDKKNWGQSDYWETPLEFMARGGDCEDFAIAKYAALRALGVPEERLRIAIVQDTQKNIPHAVLIVYTDDGLYALDNQIKSLVSAGREGRYRPIFSINRQAWWLHTAPEGTRIASR